MNLFPKEEMLDLVFEGGGAKGIAYVGALKELEKYDPEFRRIVGTSAGAILAVAIAVGYSAAEIEVVLSEKVDGKPLFASFFDVPDQFPREIIEGSQLWKAFREIDIPFVPNSVEERVDRVIFDQLCKSKRFRELFSFIECGGLYQGKRFVDWLSKLIEDKGYSSGITLAELPLEISLVSADTTLRQKLVLNRHTAPDLPVVWAVRASMSIPFVWQEVIWKSNWGTYLGQDLTGHTLIDGGINSNFALDLLIHPCAEMPACPPARIVGLLLDESLPVAGVVDQKTRFKTVDRLERTIETMRSSSDIKTIQQNQDLVCRLPCAGYSTLEMKMSDQRKELLIKAASNATKHYLQVYPL